jgi:hypothetical protein
MTFTGKNPSIGRGAGSRRRGFGRIRGRNILILRPRASIFGGAGAAHPARYKAISD